MNDEASWGRTRMALRIKYRNAPKQLAAAEYALELLEIDLAATKRAKPC